MTEIIKWNSNHRIWGGHANGKVVKYAAGAGAMAIIILLYSTDEIIQILEQQ